MRLAACGSGDPVADRQRDVAERGAKVMPFELDETTHRFAKREDGILQTVLADDPTDMSQVELVRAHLLRESAKFRRGDFDDPASIHGDAMPGLDELRTHDGRIAVTCEEIDGGATIRFRSDDPALVDALHRWADAQLVDHGEHAEAG